MGFAGGGDIGFADSAGEFLADRLEHRVQFENPRHRGEAAEQRRIRQRPAQMTPRDLARAHAAGVARRETVGEVGDPQLGEAARRIDQQIAVRLEAGKDVDGMQQRRILDDQRVGLHDRFAQPDLAVGDPAIRGHRRAHALRAEAREGLGVLALVEGRHGQHLGGGHHALAAAAMQSDFKHEGQPPLARKPANFVAPGP